MFYGHLLNYAVFILGQHINIYNKIGIIHG